MSTDIKIPENLLHADGRFGAGPSKVRAEQVQAIVDAGEANASVWVAISRAHKTAGDVAAAREGFQRVAASEAQQLPELSPSCDGRRTSQGGEPQHLQS